MTERPAPIDQGLNAEVTLENLHACDHAASETLFENGEYGSRDATSWRYCRDCGALATVSDLQRDGFAAFKQPRLIRGSVA